jgi:hypothetical protein
MFDLLVEIPKDLDFGLDLFFSVTEVELLVR